MDALGPRRVIEEPYLVKCAWIGIGQIHLATFFEIVSSDLAGIGHNSVDHFESIAVGFVLKVAADGVEGGSGKKREGRK